MSKSLSKCPNCGGEVVFKAEDQLIHCDYCGSEFKPEEAVTDVKASKREVSLLEGVCYRCTQCGASLMTFDETAVTFCSYCGSQNIMEDKLFKQMAPDCIIPFSKTKEQCIRNYKRKMSGFLFSPSYMKKSSVVQKFRGIYMPYGIYKLIHKGDCVNRGEKYHHRSGDYVYYTDYDIHADVDASYDGISFDLMSKFYDEYSMAIPFNCKKAVEFNPNYLPGFYVDAKDVDPYTYNSDAEKIGETDSIHFLKKKWTYSLHGCNMPKVNFQTAEEKTGLFPVYFLAIKDKSEKHLHYAIINGQTGKVVADMPISFMKYLIFSVLMAVPIFFLLYHLPVILPRTICLFTILFSLIAWIICSKQIKACNERESRYSDKGFSTTLADISPDGKRYKRKKYKKYRVKKEYFLKYLFGVLAPFITVLMHPVSDFPYYIVSSIGLILIILSFYDLVKIHNILVSRPIPQLEKRGGDENA